MSCPALMMCAADSNFVRCRARDFNPTSPSLFPHDMTCHTWSYLLLVVVSVTGLSKIRAYAASKCPNGTLPVDTDSYRHQLLRVSCMLGLW